MTDAVLPGGLTYRESAFVLHFANQDFQNATQAAILAGYSPRTANPASSRLLARVKVRAAIEEAREAKEKRLALSPDRTLTEAMRVAYGDATELWDTKEDGTVYLKPLKNLSRDQRAMIAGIEITTETIPQGKGQEPMVRTRTRVKLNDKIAALTLLMRHQNLLPTTARSMVVNHDNRSVSMTLQTLMAGLSTDELRATLQALRER